MPREHQVAGGIGGEHRDEAEAERREEGFRRREVATEQDDLAVGSMVDHPGTVLRRWAAWNPPPRSHGAPATRCLRFQPRGITSLR